MNKSYTNQNRAKAHHLKLISIRNLFFAAFLIFSLLLAVTNDSAAQSVKGKIAGKLVDAETGGPLIGANVVLQGTNMGAASDLEGNYLIMGVPPGQYTILVMMMGYSKVTISDVVVEAGQVIKVNASLKPEVLQADEVVVTAKAIRNAEAVLLKDRQKSIAVSDAISAEAISRSGSGNAAEAMKQVTGASIVDGKYVFVRGLGDRYTSTQLNGAEIPSSDPYKRAGSIDLIPTNLVDNIIAVKTFTPDKQGNFSGGTVDIRTKDFPEQLDLKFAAGTSFNSQTSFSDKAIGYAGGNLDWLGMDDGKRDIPDLVESDEIPNPKFDPAVLDQIIDYSRAFNPEMAPVSMKPELNQSYSFSIGNQINLFNRPLGFLGSVSYSRNYSSYNDGQYNAWSLGSSQQEQMHKVFRMNDTKTVDEVLWGGLLKASYKLTPAHILGVNFMYNINGESNARQLEGNYDYDKLDDVDDLYHSSVLSYNQRRLTSAQLSGDHYFKNLLQAKVSWNATLSRTEQDEPDIRYFTSYTVIDGENRSTGVFTNLPPTRLYRKLNEQNKDLSLDISIPFKQWSSKSATIKFGGFYGEKSRDFTERSFLYSYYGRYDGDPAAYFSPTNIRWDSTSMTIAGTTYYGYRMNLYLKNGEIGANDYDGDQIVSAGYTMVDLQLLNRLRFIGGARFEKTNIDLISLDPRKADGKISTEDILPSANLIYEIKDNMNLRTSLTRTLARPNFREIAPFAAFDFAAGFTHVGNPELTRTLIDNYDMRWEWFSRPGEIYAVSVFYKKFKNPIERAFVISASQREITWINVDDATSMGVEFEVRKNLDILHRGLKNFMLGANLSIVKSEVRISEEELQIMRINNPEISSTRELEGQSPYLLNLNLSYENYEKGIGAGVYYNIFGKRLSEISKNGQPFVYEMPVGTLNASMDWRFMKQLKIKFAAKNLLDENHKKTQTYKGAEYIFTQFARGRTFEVGFGYSL
ncbi:TonB-dependent receptor [candidate division KSB1 bacterium]|nr:TonB-dependent receptor [candidate division KSB1 bacterium]